MAGGSGTRLWPISRASRPKQLVPLIERDGALLSLLEIAAQRFDEVVPPERRYICTNERFRPFIRERMPQFTDNQILGEPIGPRRIIAVTTGFVGVLCIIRPGLAGWQPVALLPALAALRNSAANAMVWSWVSPSTPASMRSAGRLGWTVQTSVVTSMLRTVFSLC